MARLVVCALALLVVGCLSTPAKNKVQHKVVADPTFAKRQYDLNVLYYHVHEPNPIESCHAISSTWALQQIIDHCDNVAAVKTYIELMENDWILPRGVPFSINEPMHKFEASTLFEILISIRDYQTFYNTVVFFRDRINENLFVYVLNVVTLHRKDTQGISLVPIHEALPWYFHNGEIMTTAERINVQGKHWIKHYPSTYIWDDNVVIRWNETIWPYRYQQATTLSYFLHDISLNTFYYNFHLLQPSWLGGEHFSLIKDRRGELFWFFHKELVARYYMERLSNGLGEIPELDYHVVKEGYIPGLLYQSGVAFPTRPDNYHLDQPHLVDELEKISDGERRIRDAIGKGYIVNSAGEHISLRTPESIDILGRMIEASEDSPDLQFFTDFISVWKKVLGNSYVHKHKHHNQFSPLVVPSVLEHYHTAIRDPVFFTLWKRVLGLFQLWQEHLPLYKLDELTLPSVAIEKIDVDKLVTYFETSYTNLTSGLPLTVEEAKTATDDVSVLVQTPRLNHKAFQVRVHVKSEVAKTVVVRFFLAPKYDSHCTEIPLHVNSQNLAQLDEFIYDLPAGESIITRSSAENSFAVHDPKNIMTVTEEAWQAAHGHGEFVIENPLNIRKFPHHLLLPKGRVDGMPFVLVVYISEYHAPKVPVGTGFDRTKSLGLGSGARYVTDDPFGFPFNRPVYNWQVKEVPNMAAHEVLIHHKHTPEVHVPHCD